MQKDSRRWAMRAHTAHAHAALDAGIGAFRTLEEYQAYLKSAAAFRIPIERRITAAPWPAGLGAWRPRLIETALLADLADLGLAIEAEIANAAQVEGLGLFGTLYVLEGSALGAQVLYQRAQALGLSETYGARHLAVLGNNVENWRGFLEHLEQAEPFDLAAALEASSHTFALAQTAFGAA
ncbi:biliverdin-producing heme oxygenase [Aestuariivirga sp.]|uniref:biliverdin-producing heme oxygenase n=1 Tax=Aestuariivirga sp. TaxID=2650926 RepID=UPI0039E2A2EA